MACADFGGRPLGLPDPFLIVLTTLSAFLFFEPGGRPLGLPEEVAFFGLALACVGVDFPLPFGRPLGFPVDTFFGVPPTYAFFTTSHVAPSGGLPRGLPDVLGGVNANVNAGLPRLFHTGTGFFFGCN